MSELKAFESERIYWAVEQVERVVGDIDDLHLDDNLFYIKSEADNVIADLEQKLAAVQLVLRLNKPEALYSNLETMSRLRHEIYVVERRERHHKYKRCLTMASNCRLRARWFGDNAFYKKEQWALQWHRRWLKIAEKFKEAK